MYKEHTIQRVNEVASEPEITSGVETPEKRPSKKMRRYLRKRDLPKLIEMLAQGLLCKEIAYKMGKKENTIEWYLLRLRRKYNARNTMHMVMLYLKDQGYTLPFNDLI